jgi:hypothetical protein
MEFIFTDDIFRSAVDYAKAYLESRQLIFFEKYADMNRFILENNEKFPHDSVYDRCGNNLSFNNGSVIEFGFSENNEQIYKYKSAEFDSIYITKLIENYKCMWLLHKLRSPLDTPKRWCMLMECQDVYAKLIETSSGEPYKSEPFKSDYMVEDLEDEKNWDY